MVYTVYIPIYIYIKLEIGAVLIIIITTHINTLDGVDARILRDNLWYFPQLVLFKPMWFIILPF